MWPDETELFFQLTLNLALSSWRCPDEIWSSICSRITQTSMQLYNSIRHDTSQIKHVNYNRYGDVITTQRTLFNGSVPLSVKSGCGGNFLSGFVCCDWLDKPGPPLLIHDWKLGSFRLLANSKLDFVSCDSSDKRRLIVFTLSFTPISAPRPPNFDSNSDPQSISLNQDLDQLRLSCSETL